MSYVKSKKLYDHYILLGLGLGTHSASDTLVLDASLSEELSEALFM